MMKQIWEDESGQGMVEYGLILALVSIVAIVGLRKVGANVNSKFGDVDKTLEGAVLGE